MIYQFGPFELDLATMELRANGQVRNLEPQVFALLALLVENHTRLVSKDELVEKVWDGRDVSDAAVASRIKSARQALGDDGLSQRFIKTIYRQGFRFVADVRALRAPTPSAVTRSRDGSSAETLGTLASWATRQSVPAIARCASVSHAWRRRAL